MTGETAPDAHSATHEFPSRRVVLLGASNLTRGISTVVETAARVWGRPLDVLAALGHGRSYGMASSVLGRTLPGILQCGLWPALQQRPPAPTAALLTDIGNDLFYGAAVDQISEWIERCLDRLAQAEARTVVTRLPICNLPYVRPWQYSIVRRALFPACRLTLEEISQRACELDERIGRLARERNCRLLEPRAEWYGFDPIHVKLRHWSRAWRELLGAWNEEAEAGFSRASFSRWLALRRCAPERVARFGVERHRAQPSGRLDDGTSISFF
ncbi:MAG TPA: hypothetical protein VGN42_17065 [Pirellulales bacterium]|nr:hypothetical protein [Pirellulales bacterium]